jgi:predicted DNA-binding transcriptional regulator YafY
MCITKQRETMSDGKHDTLVYRLASTLIKLNQGEHIDPLSLADEYGVTLRTIQRDLNVRFAYLPIQKTNGLYHLDSFFLGKLTHQDIERFASLAGVQGLFPSLTAKFLEEIFDNSTRASLLVKGHSYESLDGKEQQFKQLEEAISLSQHIDFDYAKADSTKHYVATHPYKMINNKGIWYLIALDDKKLKTFSFSKISKLHIGQTNFELDDELLTLILDDDSVWFSKNKIEVVLKISKEVADYFLRRTLISNQVIEKKLEDGSLILSTKISHSNQLLPIIRYWVPHIRIISPETMQHELEEELLSYLNQI